MTSRPLFPALRVGDVLIDPPVMLAPMEDVTNWAFRRIAKEIANPGLMFTEFVSAMAVHYNPSRTMGKMRIHASERPLSIQIFGGEPDTMAETAAVAESMGADLLDINMGCWVPKVCKTGAGAALLKDPDLAETIVKRVVRAVRIPVTVKVRAGWDYSLFAAPELAKRFQGAGAKMITLHARFAKQGFDGEANWNLLRNLRESVSVPLVGNGDVKTPEDAVRMMRETGVDAVMVGRAAIANPWALAAICAEFRGEPRPCAPTIDERIATAVRHAILMVTHECGLDEPEMLDSMDAKERPEAEGRAIRALRGQLPLYIKGAPGAAQLRARITAINSVDELVEILHSWRDTLEPEALSG